MSMQGIGLGLIWGLAIGLAILVGWYMSRVFRGERTLLDFLTPLEQLIYRIGGIDPTKPMNWRQYAVALLTINGLWLIYAFVLLLTQANSLLWNQGISHPWSGHWH